MVDQDLMARNTIHGVAEPTFAQVADAFAENFTARGDVGASLAIVQDGALVVDLWGGSLDAAGTRPWTRNAVVNVWSTTKAVNALCFAMLVDRGQAAYADAVSRWWPEFAAGGKGDITIASVLAHRSGVIGPRARMHWSQTADWDLVCERLAAAEPWWEPGTAQGYHMVSFGFILGEVVRRATGRTIGQYLRTEIAEPMGIDVHIGLPASEHQRCADMINKPHIRDVLAAGGAPGYPGSLDEHPMAALSVAMGFVPDDELGCNDVSRWRRAEFPGTNGHVSALGLATFYNGLAQGKLLSAGHLESVRLSQGGFDPDVVLGPRVADHGWGLGYMLNQRGVAGPNLRTFGHGGSGGSYGFVDLENRIGYAYVMNYFDATKCNADPRSTALSDEVYRALGLL